MTQEPWTLALIRIFLAMIVTLFFSRPISKRMTEMTVFMKTHYLSRMSKAEIAKKVIIPSLVTFLMAIALLFLVVAIVMVRA